MRLCDLDEIKICVDRQYENCHGYSGSKKAIYREAILAVKSILHSAKSIDGVTVQEWISVTERLPEVGEVVIICTDKNFVYAGELIGDTWFLDNDSWTATVTHWMPLPEPPKGE